MDEKVTFFLVGGLGDNCDLDNPFSCPSIGALPLNSWVNILFSFLYATAHSYAIFGASSSSFLFFLCCLIWVSRRAIQIA